MKKMRLLCWILGAFVGLVPETAHSQAFDAAGSRAAGMGGAFVGVADDATAIYWNPAGLAAGAYFSLVLDRSQTSATPDGSPQGIKQSSYFLGLTTPALGLGYYRLRTAYAVPDELLLPIDSSQSSRNVTGAPFVRLDTLVTHHAGITLVQSIVPNVAVGSTLKLVRGSASSHIRETADAADTLAEDGVESAGSTKFDLDLGVMATTRRVKAGLTLRNVRQPEFLTPEGRTVRLERQARAGVSFSLLPRWIVAADVDLMAYDDAFGERRDASVGVEGQVTPRASVRSGLRFNTAGSDGSERRAVTFGGSYAVRAAVFIDAMAVLGGDHAGRGWGIAGRFVY